MISSRLVVIDLREENTKSVLKDILLLMWPISETSEFISDQKVTFSNPVDETSDQIHDSDIILA